MSKIELSVNGVGYGGWTAVHVVKSMLTLCGTFGMTAVDPWPGKPEKWELKLGDACQVKVNGHVVMTGYIDSIPLSYDDRSHNIEVIGRDKAGDLVDCVHASAKNEWKNVSAYHILSALCEPFGIDLEVESGAQGAIYSKINGAFKANEGDTVFETITRVCALKTVLALSKGAGFLTIARTGSDSANDSIVYGQNIKRGSLSQNNSDRFSAYIVKGQAKGDANKAIEDYVQPVGRYDDDVVQRYRPTQIVVDAAVTKAECDARAQWESRTRAGKSRSVTYTVCGWTQSNGDPWGLNTLVIVDDPMFKISSQLVIAEIEFTKDHSEGEISRLTLMDPEAFLVVPGAKASTKKIKSGFDPLTMQSQ